MTVKCAAWATILGNAWSPCSNQKLKSMHKVDLQNQAKCTV